MPAIVANAKNFLLNTDYPMDKVVLLDSAAFEFSSSTYSFAHGLTFKPLVKVAWSLDSDFSTVYGVGDGYPVSTPSTPFSPQLVSAYADSTSVYIDFGMIGSTPIVYIRTYALMPSDVSEDASYTASAADAFTLSTDYNYSKLYMKGKTAALTSGGATAAINHNLGYYPQAEIWFEKGDNIYALAIQYVFAGTPDSECAKMTTSTLTVNANQFYTADEIFHYRIYLDEL